MIGLWLKVCNRPLQKAGLRNQSCGDGASLSACGETEPPDILVLDLGLPDIDGLAVLKQIRQHTKSLPVLLLTARDSANDKVAGLDGGG